MDETPQPAAAPLDLELPGGRRLPADRYAWRATTSGGPGGQHANKTASKVEVVVTISELPLTPHEVARIYERLASRITGAGDLTTSCADTRDQHRNRRIAVRRMEQLIAGALRVEKRRVPTRASMGATLRRRESKQQQSQRKRGRGKRWSPEGDE
ncbi:MAG: peptide chain release factor 1 [Thermoleophilia bacterium]|nr:peptide chain release factor 1 [Thermoleophilia bacterium]